MNPKINEFIRAIQKVSPSRRPYETFRDFVELVAIRISNRVDPVHYEAREKTALHTQKQYNDDENRRIYEAFILLFEIIKSNLEREIFEDVLGRVFEEICVKVKGQDFTPGNMARLMAKITFQKDFVFPQRGYITFSDPTCGSGVLALAAAERVQEMGISCFDQFVALAVDIEVRSLYMTYIQMSLYGIPAVVLHGNTITCEEYSRWYTPMYIRGNWIWKQPLGFTCGRHLGDEKLKMMTEPAYLNWRYVDALFKQGNKPRKEKSG